MSKFQEKFDRDVRPFLGGNSDECAQYRIFLTVTPKDMHEKFHNYIQWSMELWRLYAVNFLGLENSRECNQAQRDGFDEWLYTRFETKIRGVLK